MTPRVVAEIDRVGPVAMPTCEAPPPAVSKKRGRRPGSASALIARADAVLGVARPRQRDAGLLNAHMVRPEQSKPAGAGAAGGVRGADLASASGAPRRRPRRPRWRRGTGLGRRASCAGAAVRVDAERRPAPARPAGRRPGGRCAASKRFSAARVCGPIDAVGSHAERGLHARRRRSTASSAAAGGDRARFVERRCGAGTLRPSAADVRGPTRPMAGRPWRALEALDRALGPRAEHAVGGMPSSPGAPDGRPLEPRGGRGCVDVRAARPTPGGAGDPAAKATAASARPMRRPARPPRPASLAAAARARQRVRPVVGQPRSREPGARSGWPSRRRRRG